MEKTRPFCHSLVRDKRAVLMSAFNFAKLNKKVKAKNI